jgi:formylglycine-generating enzyme required for sulfatase activity
MAASAAPPATQTATQPATQPTTQPTAQSATRAATQPSTQPAKELTLDLGNRVTMKLVLIPAGKFTMGSGPQEQADASAAAKSAGSDASFASETPQREVTISKPFYMGVYEVTQDQYEVVTGTNPSHFKGAQNPVDTVSWGDAVAFCQALSRKTGRTVRLPTEAQWEYACRAGATTPFNTGPTISTDQANYDGRYTYGNGVKGGHPDKTMVVGSFKPNAFGLHDMHGNLMEWCADWYGEDYYSASGNTVDPKGWATGTNRAMRGGSWVIPPDACRSAWRDWGTPDNRFGHYGFRVVVDAE